MEITYVESIKFYGFSLWTMKYASKNLCSKIINADIFSEIQYCVLNTEHNHRTVL